MDSPTNRSPIFCRAPARVARTPDTCMFRSMTTSNITDPETAATPMLDALDALTERIKVEIGRAHV